MRDSAFDAMSYTMIDQLMQDITPYPAASTRSDATLINCIERISDLLDKERSILDKGSLSELELVNIRKTHLLQEFSRLRNNSSSQLSTELHDRLSACQMKASRNSEALKNYLQAVQDLNQMIMDHIRKEDSDGTYSRRSSSRL
jgi:hypothetical protein